MSQDKGAISDEVATNVSGSSGSDLNITRAKSLEVLVPKGNLTERVRVFVLIVHNRYHITTIITVTQVITCKHLKDIHLSI